MKSNEKKLVGLAVILFAAVVIVRGIPYMKETYNAGLEEIEFTEQRIQRLQLLVEEAPFIKDEEELKRQEMAALQSWVFTGQDPNLVGNNVQRQLRQAVEAAGVVPRSYSTPRFSEIDGWFLVTQEMAFTIEEENILPFLELLKNSRPKLHVTEFDITRNRRQHSGSITVTGFSKAL